MRRSRLLLLVVLGAAVLGALLWARGTGRLAHLLPGSARPRNVLLISIDTLRADHLGCYGYQGAETPRLDALAARGVRFSQATTVVPLTLPAHSSLMTGTFPGHHGVRDNGGFYLGADQLTLAEMLKARGFRTGGFIGAFVLDGRWGINQGFDRYFDDFDLSKYESALGMDAVQRRGDEVVDQAQKWLDQDRQKPFFAWVHLYDPHTPYDSAPREIRERFPRTAVGAYDAEIAWTDSLVGRLIDGLRAEGRLDDTLVVVVGDHGEELGEHREQTHGFFVYDAAVHIPMIMAGPGIRPEVVDDQVRIVDVLPTVLDLLGIPIPHVVQGASLTPTLRGEHVHLLALSENWYPRYHYGWSELIAVRDGRYHFIKAPRRELYDIRADPGELHNLATQEPRIADGLQSALEAMFERVKSATAPKGPQAMDIETTERLQALGYLGGSLSPRQMEERPRGDPKDKIDLYNLLRRAGSLSFEGHLDEALAAAKKALAGDPDIIEAYMLEGNIQVKAKRFDEAVKAYKQGLALDPEHQGLLFSLAVAYKDMGRLADSEAGFERARQLDPRNGKVLFQLADIHMRQGHYAQAEAVLKEALERHVDVPRFTLKLGECYYEMKRYADAEATLRKALAAKPDIKTAHFTLALVHEDRGEPEQAVAEYEAELETNPKAYRASFNLAKLLLKAGRTAQAAERFRQTVEAQPDFATGYLYLAKALLDMGDLDGAQEAARKGLDGKIETGMAPLGHYVLADVYTRLGRPRDAAREVAAARKLERGG